MIKLRHFGIYVDNIRLVGSFYENVFSMKCVCREKKCDGVFDFIFRQHGTTVLMTKLITEKGVESGDGDMIELLQALTPQPPSQKRKNALFNSGQVHVAIECKIDQVLPLVKAYGGSVYVNPQTMENGNVMCFVNDPEGNYIELIERKGEIE